MANRKDKPVYDCGGIKLQPNLIKIRNKRKGIIWYKVLKDQEYCASFLGIFCELHDYMISSVKYDAADDAVYVNLLYDTRDEGVILQFRDVIDIKIHSKEIDETWLSGATVRLLEDGVFLWYDDDCSMEFDEVQTKDYLTWVRAGQILFAWTDGDFNIRPLTYEILNPILREYNFETKKYEHKQLHFKVYED